MEVKIKYQDIIDRCEKLSSFEADGKFDANGESRYLDIHINEVDRLLVMDYVKQAQSILEERIVRMITDVEDSVTETKPVTIEKPDTTPAFDFALIIPNGSELAKYTIVAAPQSTIGTGDMRFIISDDFQGFAYCVQESNGLYKAYTNKSHVPNNYIYETGVKKVYRCLADSKEYTWNAWGNDLVGFERKPLIEHTYTEVSLEGFTWTIRTTTRWNGIKTFTKHVNEAIVSYAMAAWLRGKLDDRVPFYEELFNNTLAMAVKNIFTKQAP